MPTSVLRHTASQLFMVGIPGPTVDDATRAFLTAHPVGGIVLFKRNVRSVAQLRRLIDDLHGLGSGVRPLVALDHEGGRVHRLPRPFTHFPAALDVARTGSPRVAEAVGYAMGRELAAVGVDVDFAPVLDVWSNPRNQVIGDRAYGTTPAAAARYAIAVARGLARAGVIACGKHFPGHGATVGDSHHVLPRVTSSRAELTRIDLPPFIRAIRAGIPSLMTAHVVYQALDPRQPATLSPTILTTLLRRKLGFAGVLFSDDLEMQAVAGHHSARRSAVRALQAGCDMLLVCQSTEVAATAIDGVARALARGTLAPDRVIEALARIQGLRRRIARRRAPRRGRLAWPGHERLRQRIAP